MVVLILMGLLLIRCVIHHLDPLIVWTNHVVLGNDMWEIKDGYMK
jgi:hypothetical protein